jgi:hypothetical protein
MSSVSKMETSEQVPDVWVIVDAEHDLGFAAPRRLKSATRSQRWP